MKEIFRNSPKNIETAATYNKHFFTENENALEFESTSPFIQ